MYFNDGKHEKLVAQNREFDDYGYPSKEFKLLDFPGGYWDKKFGGPHHKLNNAPLSASDFYWHADYGFAIIRYEEVNYATRIGGKTYWGLVERNGRNYLISKGLKKYMDKYSPTYAYCDGWSDEHQAYIIDSYY